jgi:predicted ATPase
MIYLSSFFAPITVLYGNNGFGKSTEIGLQR